VRPMNDNDAPMPPAAAEAAQDPADELPLPYIEMDANGTIIRVNRATLALHPSESGDLVGNKAWDFMLAGEKKPSCAAYLSLMESGDDPAAVYRTLYDRSGKYRIYQLHRKLKRDEEGRPAGIRMVCVDVTESKKELEEEHRARLWLESVIASLADAVIVTDTLGFIRTVNPAAEELLGWRAEELIGRVVEERVPLRFDSSSAAGGNPPGYRRFLEQRFKGAAMAMNRNREEIEVELGTSPIWDKENGSTIGVVSVLRRVRDAC
jgi:PAS domain S-box-containing protein